MREVMQQKDAQGQIETLTRRLEARTELTRMIVHDLKGPLGSIMANLDLLASGAGKLGREEREILETAIQGGNDLLHIINTLLEIGRMERGTLELNLSVINLEGMLTATAAKLKAQAMQKKIALEIACRSRVSSVAADATLFERILYNLVMNALKYTREDGTITLRAEDGRAPDTVLIAVSDTGIGIPREFQDTIFDLYTQVRLPGERKAGKRDSGGEDGGKRSAGSSPDRRRMANVGIGLAFCKFAVGQHGGRIWVESEPGKGSTFFVSLPTNLVPSGSGLI